MGESDYWQQLVNQSQNIQKLNAIDYYLNSLYQIFDKSCSGKRRILEIGAGAGTSLKYLPTRPIHRTDVILGSDPRIQGNVDAQQLPFGDETFDLVIGMDFLHHLPNPQSALIEMKRVLRSNSQEFQIVLIEPYVSLFSYLPFKVFHSEETSLFSKRKLKQPLVNNSPESGDQMIPRLFFCTKEGKRKINQIFPSEIYTVEVEYLSIFSFFLTGGINRPLPTPIWIIKYCMKIENRLPQLILKNLGSRMVIIIKKKSQQGIYKK